MRQETGKLWNAKRFDQKGVRLHFAFADESVGSIRFGRGVMIYLSDDFQTQIDLWMPFTLTQHDQSQNYNPSEITTLAPLLALVWTKITKAVADKNGFLTLEFDNGVTLQAPADQSEHVYEAWQINDKHGFQVVCAIGGSLAVWSPSAEISRRRNKSGDL